MTDIEYSILEECKCGPEEFFVLVSSVYPGTQGELDRFVAALAALIGRGLLMCTRSGTGEPFSATVETLASYVACRQQSGEKLDEPASIVPELLFATTPEGLTVLSDEDRPAEPRE